MYLIVKLDSETNGMLIVSAHIYDLLIVNIEEEALRINWLFYMI